VIALAPERFAKSFWTDRAAGAPPALVTLADEAEQARFVATSVLANREGGRGAQIAGRALPHVAP
jgi:DNA helicase-2/ATP-dependent DNA helicase PcrA